MQKGNSFAYVLTCVNYLPSYICRLNALFTSKFKLNVLYLHIIFSLHQHHFYFLGALQNASLGRSRPPALYQAKTFDDGFKLPTGAHFLARAHSFIGCTNVRKDIFDTLLNTLWQSIQSYTDQSI